MKKYIIIIVVLVLSLINLNLNAVSERMLFDFYGGDFENAQYKIDDLEELVDLYTSCGDEYGFRYMVRNKIEETLSESDKGLKEIRDIEMLSRLAGFLSWEKDLESKILKRQAEILESDEYNIRHVSSLLIFYDVVCEDNKEIISRKIFKLIEKNHEKMNLFEVSQPLYSSEFRKIYKTEVDSVNYSDSLEVFLRQKINNTNDFKSLYANFEGLKRLDCLSRGALKAFRMSLTKIVVNENNIFNLLKMKKILFSDMNIYFMSHLKKEVDNRVILSMINEFRSYPTNNVPSWLIEVLNSPELIPGYEEQNKEEVKSVGMHPDAFK